MIEGEKKEDEEDPAGQWWISVLLGLAIIAILVAGMVVSRFGRMLRMEKR